MTGELAKLRTSEQKAGAILLLSNEIRRAPVPDRRGERTNKRRKIVDFGDKPPSIKIENSRVRFKKTVRYLGVYFDRG